MFPRWSPRNRPLPVAGPLLAALLAACSVVVGLVPLASDARADDAPQVGDEAPDFELLDQAGATVSLRSFRGRRHVLLAFYPRDFSPGCTREFTTLGKQHDRAAGREVEVLGIGADDCASHARFAKSLRLPFRLLADEDLAVAKRYGVFEQAPDGAFARRSMFLVDKQGRLRFVDLAFEAAATIDGTPLAAALAALEAPDPLDALPEADRPAAQVLVELFATLTEPSAPSLERLLHAELSSGQESPAGDDAARRKQVAERLRATGSLLVDAGIKASACLDLTSLAVLRAADLAAGDLDPGTEPDAAAALPSTVRALATGLGPDAVLVTCKTRSRANGGRALLPETIGIVVRPAEGKTWKITRTWNS